MTATQGDLLAELAIADVEASAHDDWLAAARLAVQELVRIGRDFTTDDVWERLTAREVPPPHEPRAMGAVMRWAGRANLATLAPLPHVKSNRPENHARPIPVWRPTT